VCNPDEGAAIFGITIMGGIEACRSVDRLNFVGLPKLAAQEVQSEPRWRSFKDLPLSHPHPPAAPLHVFGNPAVNGGWYPVGSNLEAHGIVGR
jgi:hypothetical protein